MKVTRRLFIKQAASASLVSPFILPSRIRAAQTGPNSQVNMALIGMGIQARGFVDFFCYRDVKLVAVCDVDATRRTGALKAVERFHAEHPEKGAFACKAYNDFRDIMARKDVDAVFIATPDHWHALITLAALEFGKDVYCEKPLTHNIHEAIVVMAGVKRHKRVLQTGSHQRSASEFRVGCELVLNGVIGKVQRVTCNVGGPARDCDLPGEPAETGLDWDLWLGPAPVRPYNTALCPRGVHNNYPDWRSYWDYGGGGVCDFGAHHFDIAQWGLGMDESGPIEVRPPESADARSGAVMVYENGVTVTQVSGGFDVHFFGTEGEVKINRGGFECVRGKEVIASFTGQQDTNCAQEVRKAEETALKDAKVRLPRTKSHPEDFLARVADRQRPVASEIAGGHTAICCHLMNLAYRHHKTIEWDPHKLVFKNGSGDRSWLAGDYRKPWKV